MNIKKTISIIDDEPSVTHSLELMLKQEGYKVLAYNDAPSYINGPRGDDIIITDVRMPKMTGIELLRTIMREKGLHPVILLTGHGDIDMAVTAMKLGAHDFVEKPFSRERILESLASAQESLENRLDVQKEFSKIQQRYISLTDRQKETMKLLSEGLSNKQIAKQLDISPRTVEIHRTLVMERMEAETLSHLIRMAVDLKII